MRFWIIVAVAVVGMPMSGCGPGAAGPPSGPSDRTLLEGTSSSAGVSSPNAVGAPENERAVPAVVGTPVGRLAGSSVATATRAASSPSRATAERGRGAWWPKTRSLGPSTSWGDGAPDRVRAVRGRGSAAELQLRGADGRGHGTVRGRLGAGTLELLRTLGAKLGERALRTLWRTRARPPKGPRPAEWVA